ncbi:MAG: hypothetical protein ACTHK5_13585 [Tsuneonella sp.]
MTRPIALAAALLLPLAACHQNSDSPTAASDEGAAAPAATPIDAQPPAAPSPSDTSGIPEQGIPAIAQGRWGLVPADCTSTKGDAKGLLTVSATTLTFYESVGRLGTIRDHAENSVTAEFAFSGEGMTWTRTETLEVKDGGKTLVRTETGGDEPGSGGPFTYTRCAA